MTKLFLLAGVMTATFATGAVAQDCTASGDAEVFSVSRPTVYRTLKRRSE